jgi:hypothetical protein
MTYQTVEVLSEPTWEDVELSTLLGMDRMGEEVLKCLICEETWHTGNGFSRKYCYLLHIANINNVLPLNMATPVEL